jgi:hypothetical protein
MLSIASQMVNTSWSAPVSFNNYMYTHRGVKHYSNETSGAPFVAGHTYTGIPYSQCSIQDNWSSFLTEVAKVDAATTAHTYGLGNDCSGFVSMCWKLSTRLNTTGFYNDATTTHTYCYAMPDGTGGAYSAYLRNDLRPGDALVNPGSHIILVRQVDSTGVWTYENIPPKATSARHWTWTGSESSLGLDSYLPIRRKQITGDPAPVAPANLKATTQSTSSIGLTWEDRSSDETYFRIYRSTNGVDFTRIASVPAGTTSYPDSGLAADTTYYYKVCSFIWPDNQSSDSNVDHATTTATSGPTVTTNGVTFLGQTGVTLNATVNPNGKDTYVYFQWGPTTAYGSTSTPQDKGSGTSDVFVSQPISLLTPGQLYHYQAIAYDTTPTEKRGLDQTFTTLPASPTAPSVPQSFTATPGNAQVTLNWSAPASNGGSTITSYYIYRGTTSGGESYVTAVGGTTYSYTDTGRTNGTPYYYQVSAVNSVGEGSRCAERSATPVAIGSPPGLTLTSPNGSESWAPGSVQNLTWSVMGDTSSIHHFSLYYTVDGGNSWERVLTAAGAVVYGAPADRSYAWTVPDRFSSHAKVIVYAMNATSSMLAYDACDAFFTMAPVGVGTLPGISLVHPLGDTWTAGTTQTITWSVTGSLPASFHHFSVYASMEDGRNGSWFNVGYSATPSLSWLVPAAIGSAHARIVVYAMDATSHLLSDAFPAAFVITPATGAYGITVTAPAGGTTLHVGALTSVTWTTTGTVPPQITSYKVWYSVDGGLSWEPAGTAPSSPFSWTVPVRLSPSCSVKVVALDASSNVLGVATSPTFTIAP